MATELIPLPREDQTDPSSVRLNQRATQLNFKRLAAAAGHVSGSGTAGTIPLWTPDGYTQGNSILTQSGTTVTLTGVLSVTGAATTTGVHTFTAAPVFSSATTSRLLATGAGKAAESVSDLTSWIAGTANQITSTSDGDGTLTLSLPSAVLVGTGTANPAGETNDITIGAGSAGNVVASLTTRGFRTTDAAFGHWYAYHGSNLVGRASWFRDGADNSGKLAFGTSNAGVMTNWTTLNKTGVLAHTGAMTVGGTLAATGDATFNGAVKIPNIPVGSGALVVMTASGLAYASDLSWVEGAPGSISIDADQTTYGNLTVGGWARVNTGFFKLPELGSAPASPENGMMYYDSAGHHLVVRANGAWVEVV